MSYLRNLCVMFKDICVRLFILSLWIKHDACRKHDAKHDGRKDMRHVVKSFIYKQLSGLHDSCDGSMLLKYINLLYIYDRENRVYCKT